MSDHSPEAITRRLQDADEEIAGTLAHLHRLRARRTDILVDRNLASAAIFKLPSELICEIFLRCLPPTRTLPTPRDTPLLLGQVCRTWRSIALSLPTLWRQISVPVDLAADPQSELRAPLLELWLERAGTCNLSVSIVLPEIPPQYVDPHTVRCPLFRTVRSTSHRWRELEIVRPLEDYTALLAPDDPWRLPDLVKLTMLLSRNGRPSVQFPMQGCLTSLDVPVLREAHIMGFTPSRLLLPWSQLTTLNAENLLPLEVLQTLAQTTQLIDGTFSVWPIQRHLPNAEPPSVRLPRLQTLTLSGELVTELFDYLDFPSLKQFTLSMEAGNEFTPLIGFFARLPNLKDVALEVRGAIGIADFSRCLEALEGIERLELSLHMGVMNGGLPHGLINNPALLPNLRRLVIKERMDRYHEPPLEPAVLVLMLQARRARGMEAFCLVSTHVWSPIDPALAALAPLAKEGMEIELRSHGSGPFRVVYYSSTLRRIH